MPRTRTYGLDIDTIRFAQRVEQGSGTTILPEPLKQINKFVVGIKKLKLWDSMVCWPMRSIHNAGTGSTVYSLGGLGTFNGTGVNSPTWNFYGIEFNGNNQRITLPNNSFGTGNAATSIWVFAKNDTNAVRMVLLSHGNNNNSTDGFSLESPDTTLTNDGVSIAFTGSTIATKSTLWKSLFIGNTSFGFRGKDGGSVTQFTLNNTLNKSGTSNAIGAFGNPAGVAPFDGLVASVIRISVTPTTELNNLVHTLYKRTLGIGLNLP